MEFFLYGAKPGMDEEAYKALVGENNAGAPGKRVARVDYEHNGEFFIAEVGKEIQIKKPWPVKHDSAIVRAIVRGNPILVHTTARQVDGPEGRSTWANPFMIGITSAQQILTFDEIK